MKFKPEYANWILDEMIEGDYLKNIIIRGREQWGTDFPCRREFYRWTEADEEFREAYRRAQEWQLESWASENIAIADDSSKDFNAFEQTRISKNGTTVIEKGIKSDNTAVNRAALRIRAREWQMCRLGRAKWGDSQRLEHTGKDGKDLKVVINISRKAKPGEA